MAELKGLKKTIVYSSEKEKKFIEGALNILSIQKKQTASAVLEDLINKALLPENINANVICKELYANEIKNMQALEKVFDIYAGGINNEARYSNGYDLVNYLHNELQFMVYPKGKDYEGLRQYFCSNFFQIYKIIKASCSSDNEENLLVYESPVKYAKYHLDEASDKEGCFIPINLTDIIKKHWDILGNFTYTYRTLSALCRLIAPQSTDSPEDRISLITLISHLSEEWD